MTDRPKPARRTARKSNPDVWMTHEYADPATRAAVGKAARRRVPRVSHASFEPASGRDPIAILDRQEADRLQDLLPLRHQRMAESAVRVLPRHAGGHGVRPGRHAAVRTSSSRPAATRTSRTSGCSRRPSGRLVFDANDFDETLPGPVGVGRQAPGGELRHRRTGQRVQPRPGPQGGDGVRARLSRSGWRDTPRMPTVDVWYAVITDADIRELLQQIDRHARADPAPARRARSRPSSRSRARGTACVPSRR